MDTTDTESTSVEALKEAWVEWNPVDHGIWTLDNVKRNRGSEEGDAITDEEWRTFTREIGTYRCNGCGTPCAFGTCDACKDVGEGE